MDSTETATVMNGRSRRVDHVKAMIPSSLKNILLRARASLAWNPHQVISYSQEGEDLILSRIFGQRKSGFYVDVGAHHPQRFSNTYLFYRRGWRGINIDAMPGSMAPFRRIRPRDILLEIPIMKQKGRLTYYQFNEPALNGFSKELSESRDGRAGYKIIRTSEIEGAPLVDVLQKHLPAGMSIDFLSVDVEGLDLDVLQSNDWSRYRPKVVLAELLVSTLADVHSNPVHQLMEQHGYRIYAKSMNTVFFLSEEFSRERAEG